MTRSGPADPALTVVLAMRDAAAYLDDALGSLTRNWRPDFELVVIDDGSVDASVAVLDAYRDALPGLRLLQHAAPLGVSRSRNEGLDTARGRYVMFFDADDWLAPDHLPQLVAAADALGCDFVRTDHVRVEGRRRVLQRAPGGPRDVVLVPREHILPAGERTMVDYAYPWAGLYRRSLGELLRLDPRLHTAADRPWTWRLHREAASFAVVSLAGVFYRRQVATSLTRTADARTLHFLDAYRTVFDEVRADPRPGPDLLPKAVRQFVAVFAHHLAKADGLPPVLRSELGRRGRELLADLPRDVVLDVPLTAERRALVWPYLPGGRMRAFAR